MKWLKKLPCEISGVNSFEVSSPQWGGDNDPGTHMITGAPSQYTWRRKEDATVLLPDHSDNAEPAPQPQAEAGREPSLGVGEV